MNIICLVLDGLQAGYLGPYGNSWVETPEWNTLAAEGFVCDAVFVPTPGVKGLYPQVLWGGQHPLQAPVGVGGSPRLLLAAERAGRPTLCVTDDADVERLAEPWFDEVVPVEPHSPGAPAADVESTQLASLFAVANDLLDRLRSAGPKGSLLWIHGQTLLRSWDAPADLRELYAREDEPDDEPLPEGEVAETPPAEPPTGGASLARQIALRQVEPPQTLLAADFDPDERLGYQWAYAAQMTLLDRCLGAFFSAVRQMPEPTAVVLTSTGGYPLGEHRQVGPQPASLYAESLQVPLLWWFSNGRGRLGRSQSLVEVTDLPATLIDLCDRTGQPTGSWGQSLLPLIDDKPTAWRDRLGFAAANQFALRTSAWLLKRKIPAAEELPAGLPPEPQVELYTKPDDRWEVNDVAERCPNEMEALIKAEADWRAALEAGRPDDMPPLPQILREIVA